MEIGVLKYFIFFSALFFGVPVGILACRAYKSFMYVIFAIALFSTMFYYRTEITFFHQEWYKTATWGFNITLSDLCLLILFVTMLMRPAEYPIRWIVPLTGPFALYLIIGIMSWLFTIGQELPNPYHQEPGEETFQIGMYPLFEIWKIIRFFFAIFVLTNFVNDRKSLTVVLFCFSTMILILIFRALIERYLYKFHVVSGGMIQHHLFNVFIGMLGAFLFPFIFYYQSMLKKLFFSFLCLCALVGIILTISRAATLAFLASLVIASVVIIFRFYTARNLLIFAVIFLASLALFTKSADTLYSRFNVEEIESSISGRESLNDKAIQMALDHPFGVGLGNYSAFYVNHYFNEGDEPVSIAHNIFFLNLGEVGFAGLIAFCLIYLRLYQMLIFDFIRLWKTKLLMTVLIAALASLCVLQIQDLFHFSSRHNSLALIMQVMIAYISRIYYDKERMLASYENHTRHIRLE